MENLWIMCQQAYMDIEAVKPTSCDSPSFMNNFTVLSISNMNLNESNKIMEVIKNDNLTYGTEYLFQITVYKFFEDQLVKRAFKSFVHKTGSHNLLIKKFHVIYNPSIILIIKDLFKFDLNGRISADSESAISLTLPKLRECYSEFFITCTDSYLNVTNATKISDETAKCTNLLPYENYTITSNLIYLSDSVENSIWTYSSTVIIY